MKKTIEYLAASLCSLLLLTGCTDEQGTEPGGDSAPMATVYQYTAGEGYNADNDCLIRVATNAAARETYYLAELKSAKEEHKMDEAQYADYVVKNGTKIDVSASGYKDLYVTNLHGMYVITVVATNGSARSSQSVEFAGLDYKPFGTGTYVCDFLGFADEVSIEYSEVGNRYRISSVWTEGYGFSFSPSGDKVTVYPTQMETGYVHPTYGMVSVSDQGSTYDEASKTFTFTFKWTVAAGSYGNYADVLTLK